ncbi:MAG: DUF3592 domain-containing protein [Bacteroidales bacterium]
MSFEIFTYCLISTGSLLALYNLLLIIRARSTKNWDTADGIVLDSELIEFSSSYESASSFKPRIEYSYSVNGKEYKSNRVYFGSHIMTFFNKQNSRKTVTKYPKGVNVIVHYDRLNEKQSVLETGVKYQIIIGFVLGLIIIGIGLILLLYPNAQVFF